jgi:hypothetical protein
MRRMFLTSLAMVSALAIPATLLSRPATAAGKSPLTLTLRQPKAPKPYSGKTSTAKSATKSTGAGGKYLRLYNQSSQAKKTK